MTVFWLLSGLMLLLALLMLLPSLLNAGSLKRSQRAAQNVLIAQERLADLTTDLEAGMINQDDFDAARIELEKSLLLDTDADDETPPREATAFKTMFGKESALSVFLFVPLFTIPVYLALGQVDAVDPEQSVVANIAAQQAAQLAGNTQQASIEEMMLALEARIAENPNDPDGWFMLGKTNMSLQRYSKAVMAFEKLRELVGDQVQVLIYLSDAKAMLNGGSMSGEPTQLIEKALELEPNNLIALWLTAMAAEEQGDYKKALPLFLRLLPQLGEDPRSAQQVRVIITKLSEKLGLDAKEQLAKAEAASVAITEQTEAQTGETQAAGVRLKLLVKLDEKFAASVNENDTLFILAKAINGPPMPLAVVKKKVRDLPLTIELNDSMAMLPQARLSHFAQVKLIARISRSSNPLQQSGDLFAELSPVSVPNENLQTLVINQQAP